MDYMAPHEVEASAKLGNRIARKITNGRRIMHNATIRHALASKGIHDATALACQLLGMNHADACKHVAALATTKADDIVSPYYT